MNIARKFIIPRSVRLLAQHGAEALKYKIVEGRYIAPLVSSRKAAMVRKRAIVDGTFGTFSPVTGGWLPEWDEPRKMFIIKPNKGHLRERTRPARFEKVEKAMAGMPERFEKLAQEARERKPKKDLNYLFKRVETLYGTKDEADYRAANARNAGGKAGKSKDGKKKGK